MTCRKLAASDELHQLSLIKGCSVLMFQLIPYGGSSTLLASTRERPVLLGLEHSSQRTANDHRTLHSRMHRRRTVPALSNGDVPYGVASSSQSGEGHEGQQLASTSTPAAKGELGKLHPPC